MPSEQPPADGLARLADLLAEASGGDRPSPRELAELLWLARHMRAPHEPERDPDAGTEAGAAAGQREDDGTPAAEPPPAPQPPPPPGDDSPPPAPGRRRPDPPRAPLHLPAPAGTATARHAALLAPAPPMLRHPLALQRALRPLKRRADAPLGQELDERATAERIARLGGDPDTWLPVMRPARERWLSLRLVHDTGPTMPVWRPLVRELHTALAQSGVFRTVTVHPAGPDGSVPADAAHTPADGRTVVLLVSDCMGPQWRRGPAAGLWYATLRRWAHRMPLAVVQPLPEHLWRDTALPTVPGHLSAPGPAAPTATLTFTPYDDDPQEAPAEGALFLPVLEPDPHWLANWAALTAGSGGTPYPAAVARLDGTAPAAAPDRTDLALLTPEELVLRFRATASPQAFRLAGHLALGRPDLPVMRLVQAAVEPDPRPQHLAEVILGGLLTAVPGPPGSYAFRPGVRDLLLRGLPRTARARTTELLEQVGALIDTRAGRAPGEFLASTPAENGTASPVQSEAFASVSEESVRRLAGNVAPPAAPGDRYRLLGPGRPDGSVWQAYDTRTDRRVLLRLCPAPVTPERREAFLRHAEALARLDDPGVVTVLDHGVRDGVPYVTTEDPDGIALDALALGYPGGLRLPAPLTVSIGNQLARALIALHRASVAHGAVDLGQVVLLPDGTVKLTVPDLGQEPGPEDFAGDLRALGAMLWQLASGAPFRPGTRVTADRLSALPAALRRLYSAALADTLSGSLTRQREGAARLQRRALLDLARADHVPLRYVLFGRPAVTRGAGQPVATGSPQERAMLCMLLLSHGRKVTHAKLVDGIWGTRAPARATRLLGTYASRLRNALGPGVLAALPGGYALHTSTDHVDLVECQQLVARAEVARAAGDAERARGHLTAALVLWKGPALEGVSGPAAQTARTRLQQLRLTLSRRRAELDLDLDEVDRAAADLAELVREHPSREDFRRLYLIALRRQGRLEEALEVFEEYELSGGRSPELLALGQELREEYGGPPGEDGVAAPDEDPRTEPDDVPAGSFPTEEDLPSLPARDEEFRDDRPLPRDEVPDSLFPDASPEPRRPSGPSAARALRAAQAVILGFDGTLTRLYTREERLRTVRSLARLLVEERDPGDALSGRPLLPGGPDPLRDDRLPRPVDLLRAFRGRPYARDLHDTLAAAEVSAAGRAGLRPHADTVVRTLHRKGVRLAVVTDTAPAAATAFLERHGLLGLLAGGVHGRETGRTALPPDDEILRAAVAAVGVPPARCLVVGVTRAEQEAARAVGALFHPAGLLPLLAAARGL
ncbi:SAV_2336 N-terminal domain-related protein [Streptomyces sp. JB150]|uniref:SAV_2336 N-terminal domain-related protein n=1 Tax=Streptomyces sp. JB150 TaxID=2714844 RepID=UPI00140D0062|nr:SAV_2336 N-terminal domain-related protein [Streptomyces sp. JB150]QIJ62425.1 HAD hydrolase-like protein [Streptomyces sp. JB150]